MIYNTSKLDSELRAAGIVFMSCNSLGVVLDMDGITQIQTRPDVAAVLAAHDPIDYNAIEYSETIQRLRDEYVASTTKLQQIIDFSGTITLTILGSAVKDIARILLLLLKLLRRQYNEG